MLKFLVRSPLWFICFTAIVSVSSYWTFLASDRYVSEANVVLESPQIALPSLSFSSLLSGGGSGTSDMLLLRDFLLSVDMLKEIEQRVAFRDHYADQGIDMISRLFDHDAPIEDLHKYYLKRISVELDEYAKVLRIRVQAFAPEMAHQISRLLLQRGETHMNTMGQRLAEEQVKFLETQVGGLNQRFNDARQALLDYQNENGLVSPTGTVESLNAVVARLESELTTLRAKRTVLSSYQSIMSPEMVRIDAQIKATVEQIIQERSRMAQQSGGALNSVSSEYQTLELKAQFAQESYSGALAALESTRIEAARKLKQVSVLQSPTLPEYAVEPERLYNTTVFVIIALFLALIAQMMLLIIKDHRD
tara:strand:- start:14955 stop:16043 length:1089 start_codon:yes stop_codon:yes gene_type:complete